MTLAELRGHPAAVVFWASWCTDCHVEASAVERFARSAAGRGRVVGVDYDDGGDWRAFLRTHGWRFPVARRRRAAAIGAAFGIARPAGDRDPRLERPDRRRSATACRPSAASPPALAAARLTSRHACERMFVSMTSDGTAYGRFRRALRMGNLAQVRAAAAELPQVGLDDALAVVLLMDEHDDERYERAAVRWLARLVERAPGRRARRPRARPDRARGAAPQPRRRDRGARARSARATASAIARARADRPARRRQRAIRSSTRPGARDPHAQPAAGRGADASRARCVTCQAAT